jgi:ribosomal protein S18 acetylase RimI-like enzyme
MDKEHPIPGRNSHEISEKKDSIELRPFDMADMQAVIHLRLEARRTDPAAFPRSYESEAATTQEAWLERFGKYATQSDKSMLFVAARGAEVAGAVGARINEAGVWELHGVYVRPAYRKHGIAERLVREATRAIKERGGSRITLMVTEGQGAAIELYKKCGFVMTGNSSAVMGDGAEHKKIVFEKIL